MTRAYVGLGANLGDAQGTIRQAMDQLDALPNTRIAARSPLYRSAPVGYAAQPDFVNAVAEVRTSLAAGELLAALIEIEERHGRERSFANAPRTLDLDLLLYGDEMMQSARLTLPHPRMHERAFVLKPLLDLAPGIAIPGHGPAAELLARCAAQKIERMP
ncbi:MAG TPA: 2-amino-4-hydroxy-6-hydroxymethyldihydropteridine diphosphokinase [Burkholderiales bacterium]|jgi:2-amino-4-hydroxy-6-hydroxymethyldihydropteridine diphosphokinase|nr:2-amino-4-hydroxy-6-hydroxymethyldihydropteridine diphosphokinase [Burkholderiales bacterium]HEX2648752.1 2-amino-4-hydroxy-6-hydroxymethyldihydropteridine diphosphokinase [Burkholderiales bacterium]